MRARRYAPKSLLAGRSMCLRGAWIQILRVSPSIELRSSFNSILRISSPNLGSYQGRTSGGAQAGSFDCPSPSFVRLPKLELNSFSQMGSHPSFLIGKLCRSAFSLILARSFWTGRDVSSAEVRGLQESLARLPSPFEVPIAQKEEPDDADKAFTTSLIHLLRTSRKSAVTRSMRSEGPCKLAEASGTFG